MRIYVNISMIIGVFVVINCDNFFFLILKKLNIKYIGIINIILNKK